MKLMKPSKINRKLCKVDKVKKIDKIKKIKSSQ